jgi:hypothetical protein
VAEETFYGLFVGLDVYESPKFRSLNFAAKDATVLQALFQDNFAGESNLVLDHEATKDKFLTEIRHIASVSTDGDVVVIAFSGHGTMSGELAMYDANPNKLSQTALSLEAFVAPRDCSSWCSTAVSSAGISRRC